MALISAMMLAAATPAAAVPVPPAPSNPSVSKEVLVQQSTLTCATGKTFGVTLRFKRHQGIIAAEVLDNGLQLPKAELDKTAAWLSGATDLGGVVLSCSTDGVGALVKVGFVRVADRKPAQMSLDFWIRNKSVQKGNIKEAPL